MLPDPTSPKQTKPILLFDNECGVCRRIAKWVNQSAQLKSGETSLIVRPIGDDPEALRVLNPGLDIWEAYATIHVVMPDGSMRRGGEAVAEVLRKLPPTTWLARSFAISVFGFRPFQAVLNMGYVAAARVWSASQAERDSSLHGSGETSAPHLEHGAFKQSWVTGRRVSRGPRPAGAPRADCRQTKRRKSD